MGSLVPVASTAVQAFQTANNVISTIAPIANVVSRGVDFFDSDTGRADLNLAQLEQRNRIEQQQAAQKAALDKQELQAKAEIAEKTRRDALKRAVSRQRARFGSSGVSANGGSSEAVLLGLFEESDTDRSERERLDTLRVNAIDQNLSQSKRVNTLQREQLKQTQNLKNQIDPLDAVKGFFDIF